MSLSKREKGLAVGVVALGAGLALYYLLLQPVLDQQAELETQRDQIASDMEHSGKVLAESQALGEQWKKMTAVGLKVDPAEAEGQLLNDLGSWAKGSGFTLVSVKPDRPESKGPLKEIQAVVVGNAAMDGVARFLWKIQTAPFPLKIVEFQLGARTDNATDLALQVKLSTLYCPPEQPGAKTAKKRGNGGTR